MKINKVSFNKKPLIITLIVVIVAILGYGAYAIAANQWPFKTQTPNNTMSSNSTSATNTQTPAETSESTDEPNQAPESSPKTPTENEGSTDMPKNQVGVTITSINTSDGIVKVKTLIEAIISTGTCTLTFEKGDEVVTKTSGIQPMPGSSTCKGFNVPVSELSKGTWQVKLSVATGEKAGSASQSYKVQ